jgi:hypothetical protein
MPPYCGQKTKLIKDNKKSQSATHVLHPNFSYDDVMHTAVDILPRVCLLVSEKKRLEQNKMNDKSQWNLFRCNVTMPFGVTSTDLPQNLSFG